MPTLAENRAEVLAIGCLPELVPADETEKAVRREEFKAPFDEDHIDVVVAFGGRLVAPLVELALIRGPLVEFLHADIGRVADDAVEALMFLKEPSKAAGLARPVKGIDSKAYITGLSQVSCGAGGSGEELCEGSGHFA